MKFRWPVLAGFIALLLHVFGSMEPIELQIRDAILRRLPTRPGLSVCAVLLDDDSLQAIGHWPWNRAQLADLVDAMYAAGAKGVVLDLLLPESADGDHALARALASGPSALAVGLDPRGNWLLPAPGLRGPDLGHVSFDLDRDGVVRRFSSTRQSVDRGFPALAVAAARLKQPDLPIPVGIDLRPGFRTRPIPSVSAVDLLRGQAGERLRGRVAFLGASAAGVGDRFVSPISPGGSPEPGVLIEAISTEAILSGDLLKRSSPLIAFGMALALAMLIVRLLEGAVRFRFAMAAGLVFAPFAMAILALQTLHLELAPVAIATSLTLTGTAAGIGRFRRVHAAMFEARKRIEELEKIKNALSDSQQQAIEARRVMAHEMKNPLASVRGLAQLMSQFDLSTEERTRVTGLVVAETSRLSDMVDALLDLERLRLKAFDRDARRLDLSKLVEGRVAVLQAGTPRTIRVGIQPGLDVQGDEALLVRVLENLVSNAFKYSTEGEPVRIVVRSEKAQVCLEVEDQGPGIPVEDRDRIFRRFDRGSAPDQTSGLGLGLALVAETVAWHQGTVEVTEGERGGSVFRVRLPQAPP